MRVTGLPRARRGADRGQAGDGRRGLHGRPLRDGDVQAGRKRPGDLGTLDILVEDGRGGSVLGSLPIRVIASNRPPVVEARRRLRIYTGALGIVPPTDPDGDKLTVTVTSLPRGLMRFGVTTIHVGDHLEPEQLPALVYVPEPGFSGSAGTFQYLVDDGRGGRTEGALDIDVMDPAEAAAQMAEAAVWDRLRASGRLEDVETFLRLYPTSYLAAAARRRRDELVAQNAPAAPPPAAAQRPSRPAAEWAAGGRGGQCCPRRLRRRHRWLRSSPPRPRSWQPCSRSRRRSRRPSRRGGTSPWSCRRSHRHLPAAITACSRIAPPASGWSAFPAARS